MKPFAIYLQNMFRIYSFKLIICTIFADALQEEAANTLQTSIYLAKGLQMIT